MGIVTRVDGKAFLLRGVNNMKNALKKLNGVTVMDSREIANMTGKKHYNVVRDIRNMLSEIDDSNLSHLKEEKDKRGYTKNFLLPYRETITLLSGYSVSLRHKIISRWMMLEQHMQERQEARLEAPRMTQALKEQRELEGKDTKPFHYANEYNLLYRIIFGQSAKEFRIDHGIDPNDSIRDVMTTEELSAVEQLQQYNRMLMDMGKDYHERKEDLKNLFDRKHAQRLIDEMHRMD